MRDLRALNIEGLEQWPAGVDEWDTPEVLAFSEGRSEATLRLEAVMKSQAVATRRRVLGVWIAAAAVVGLLGGCCRCLAEPSRIPAGMSHPRLWNGRSPPSCSIGTP